MKNKYKSLDKIYYADLEKNTIVKALWWNWSSRCGEVELDVICTNLERKNGKEGDVLPEDELMRVDIKKIFQTEKEAIDYLLTNKT